MSELILTNIGSHHLHINCLVLGLTDFKEVG